MNPASEPPDAPAIGSADLPSALLELARTFRWPARSAARTGLPGAHLARTIGSSIEFREYRAYRPGDDTRRIDWKLLARRDRAYIRKASHQSVAPTFFVLDATASMAYPVADRGKWRYATHLALGLASCALAGGDPVGVTIAANDGQRTLPPRMRRTVVHEMALLMGSVSPAGSAPVGAWFGARAADGRTVIISDFLSAGDDFVRTAGAIVAAGREVYALHIVHPDELDPPTSAPVITDPEDVSMRRPVTPATVAKYRETFAEWRGALARDWRRIGASYFELVTSEPVARAIRRIVMPAGR